MSIAKHTLHPHIFYHENTITRSSHQRRSVKKGVLGNFTKLTGKHLCQSLFFNKVAGLRPATLLKERLWHRCFSANFTKFLKLPFLAEHLQWLLLVLELVILFLRLLSMLRLGTILLKNVLNVSTGSSLFSIFLLLSFNVMHSLWEAL